jgi:hypothetical protein
MQQRIRSLWSHACASVHAPPCACASVHMYSLRYWLDECPTPPCVLLCAGVGWCNHRGCKHGLRRLLHTFYLRRARTVARSTSRQPAGTSGTPPPTAGSPSRCSLQNKHGRCENQHSSSIRLSSQWPDTDWGIPWTRRAAGRIRASRGRTYSASAGPAGAFVWRPVPATASRSRAPLHRLAVR